MTAPIPPQYTYRATCIHVVDGDTLDLAIDLGFDVHVHHRIRLHGVDTPETYGVRKDGEEYAAGMRATTRVEELVTGTPLIVETLKDRRGKYGRYLARIHFEHEGGWCELARMLVDEGLAVERVY